MSAPGTQTDLLGAKTGICCARITPLVGNARVCDKRLILTNTREHRGHIAAAVTQIT